MAKQREPRLVIKEHRPWRGWLFNFLLVTGGGVAGWLLAPQATIWLERGGEENQSSLRSTSPPQQLPSLEKENTRLREYIIRIQQELEVEQQTRAELSANLITLQNEIVELKRQLATYKRLVKSLQEQEQGLHIEELSFSKTKTDRLFRYRLVLTQGRKKNQFNQGEVEFIIHGILDGKSEKFSLDTLSRDDPLTFKFKYFQILEGEFLLPDDFKPTQVEIILFPQRASSESVVRTFDWNSLRQERLD